jgi:hypothetical protein
MRKLLITCAIVFVVATARAQDSLPTVSEVEWKPFKAHVADLLKAMNEVKEPLNNARDIQALLDNPGKDTDAACAQVQKLLDLHCLIAVAINPESRVKAARGPASSDLAKDKARIVLVRVQNDAGITHPLRVSGDDLRSDSNKTGWLQAKMIAPASLGKTLSGQRLEYLVLELQPGEAGKREATLKFDAGQGTQDLGFRAEVPILFRVR